MICVTYKPKNCLRCGTCFQPKSSKSIYCSKECAYKNKRERILEWRKNNQEKHKLKCEEYNKNRDVKNLKEGKIVLKFLENVCSICCGKFKPIGNNQKYCSNKCKNFFENEQKKLKRKNNIKHFRDIDKKQYYKHHDRYKKQKVAVKMKRYHNNASFKIGELMRGRLRVALNGNKKTASILVLVGCSLFRLKQHIESQFKEGMSWENHGLYGWHIDHIVPCSHFDFTKKEDQYKCFNYKNLQPLWAEENLSKGARI